MKDPFNWAVTRQHLGSVLDMTVQQRSQTQTPLGDKLSVARTKTIGTNENLELENACPMEKHSDFFCFFFLI